jgi:hypothetical protein
MAANTEPDESRMDDKPAIRKIDPNLPQSLAASSLLFFR